MKLQIRIGNDTRSHAHQHIYPDIIQSHTQIHHLENRWNEMILLVMNLDAWKIVMRTNIDCMNSRDVMKEGSKWISAPPMLIIIHTHLRLPLPNVRMFDGRRLITNVLMDYLPKFKSKYFCALDLFPNIIRHLCNFRFMHTSLILLNIRTFAHCFYRIFWAFFHLEYIPKTLWL